MHNSLHISGLSSALTLSAVYLQPHIGVKATKNNKFGTNEHYRGVGL